jgi:hypothetical protein
MLFGADGEFGRREEARQEDFGQENQSRKNKLSREETKAAMNPRTPKPVVPHFALAVPRLVGVSTSTRHRVLQLRRQKFSENTCFSGDLGIGLEHYDEICRTFPRLALMPHDDRRTQGERRRSQFGIRRLLGGVWGEPAREGLHETCRELGLGNDP